jgi:monofunctional glycosyltransferase
MVKNVYLSDSRTLWRKLHEIILAFKVEEVLSKERILEIYFNCIEYGPGIYGIKNASHHYFRKHPSALTPREAAFLAMLLPSPKRYYISFKKKQLTKFAQIRIKAILTKMRMGKIITPEQYQSELDKKFSWEH